MRYEFDDLGRVIRTSKSLPNGQVSVVENRYDALGRKTAVSQPEASVSHPSTPVGVHWTTTTFDALHRPTKIVPPDNAQTGAQITITYTGDRVVERKNYVATSLGPLTESVTKEYYDAQKRLVKVEQDAAGTSVSSPRGGKVTAMYGYDVGGKLTSVAMTGGGVTQSRTFEYDRRGFLMREMHPENGETRYEQYDPQGHAARRTSGGKTLSFEYDDAERIRSVHVVNAVGTTPLKNFTYATANAGTSFQKGKLVKAVRHNQLSGAGNIDVTETYEYAAALGQLSKRTTLVEAVSGSGRTPIQNFEYTVPQYDALGLARNIGMPACSLHGCNASAGITNVTYERRADFLTSIGAVEAGASSSTAIAAIDYHPNGMVQTVKQFSDPTAVDTYETEHGLTRPSRIQFGTMTLCLLTASGIGAPASVAAGATASASVPSRTSEGVTHVWSIVNGTFISDHTGDDVVFRAGTSGFVTLKVTASNDCGNRMSERSITIGDRPNCPTDPSVITAPTLVDAGSTENLASVPSRTADGITHSWEITNGTITSNPQSHLITFQAGFAEDIILTVTATNACGDSMVSTQVVPVKLPSPAWISATARTDAPTIVDLRWDPVPGASGYLLERASVFGGATVWSTSIADAAVTSFTDSRTPSAEPVTAFYYVRTVSRGGTSKRGAFDHATTASQLYVQPTIVPGVTEIMGADILELRRAVNAFCRALNTAEPFPAATAPIGEATAAHFQSLVTALNTARAAKGWAPFGYAGVPAPALGEVIVAEHLRQLREALR
jgi:YD repeat-containing protein